MKWALVATATQIEAVPFHDYNDDDDVRKWAKDNRCVWWQWGLELGGRHAESAETVHSVGGLRD